MVFSSCFKIVISTRMVFSSCFKIVISKRMVSYFRMLMQIQTQWTYPQAFVVKSSRTCVIDVYAQ